ncbi:phenylalanine--tRNA ligase subunit beta [Psychrobium sp. 1_MG-2023]|uniref:phenylalanine--tRNA ligase subunit beta n=1 Tax=Psychrobium sp. 1_MG-2023 TaxID=3062624 RepID=UPI000C34A3CA|nr:phenylalanine--tRNA ligase subunit beta [Psychrobium sp. 1_MG-2023]MDP2560322.1 phenylalanine--tRNA ligase subunit beta [Psychrobium sp. 1_MG-2023]PKF55435.1 phenylalanine--tRNA ligase subunit beta [Alteromonadales bacterium alter-6D02]
MKFSESWLREWVNPNVTSDELSAQLTMAGLEVDDVTPVAASFTNVVVGEVVECGQHPDADKLQVTKINVGDDELVDIVCGAKNCRQGLKVAVAKVGAVLPGDFKIKKAKLRGQPSFGMLCSFSELGMADDSDGILELPSDAPIGTCVREYLSLDDVTIDVDLTANRADCLGIKGLAREVAVLNRTEITPVSISPAQVSIDDTVEIKLTANEACPRYLGRVIKGINLNAVSPLWLTEKLRRSGIRSIDPVVDVTNYVLLELGHPMHAFDLAKIDGAIDVRLANTDETLTLLDGNEAKLNQDTLVIADNNKALAIAGIFGGQDSGVTEQTQDIFLESAFFAPLAIAGQARKYGLHTDASHRYERGVDFELQSDAMERATNLLLEIVGGQAGPVVEAVSQEALPKVVDIELRRSRIARIIGITIADEEISEILTRLGIDVTVTEQGWVCRSPSYRFDINIESDLVEEVARVYGYNNIPNVSPTATLSMSAHNEKQLPVRKLRDVLVARGFNEAITYSFVDPKKQQLLFPELDAKVLPHPISADMSVMRVSLWTGLLQAVSNNQKRQQGRVRLFETGLRFYPNSESEHGISQDPMISGVIAGGISDEHWDIENRSVDFFDLKGDLEALMELSADIGKFEFRKANLSALHPGQSAEIFVNDESVGFIGAIHPQHEKALGLNGRTIVFEITQAALLQRKLPEAVAQSKFPANRRDIALVVKDDVNAKDVIKSIQNVGENQLVGINLFDVYRGQGIEEGYKSLAIALTLQDSTRTLEEKEIALVVEKAVQAANDSFGATLRD